MVPSASLILWPVGMGHGLKVPPSPQPEDCALFRGPGQALAAPLFNLGSFACIMSLSPVLLS